jgi:hypothetical protein
LKIWQSAHDCNFESSAIRFYELIVHSKRKNGFASEISCWAQDQIPPRSPRTIPASFWFFPNYFLLAEDFVTMEVLNLAAAKETNREKLRKIGQEYTA